jgi:hypothetical protein
MRRLIIGLTCLATAIAVAPQVAAAKGVVELRATPPAGLSAGETWHADLFVRASPQELAAADPPTILIHNDAAGWSKFSARPVPGEPGAYTAAVVFPDGGTWTYHVHDPIAGGGYDFDPVVVAAADSSGGGFPVWWVLGSLVGLAGLGAVAIQLRDRLRRRHDPAELRIEVRSGNAR